jgi:hypothetical protein
MGKRKNRNKAHIYAEDTNPVNKSTRIELGAIRVAQGSKNAYIITQVYNASKAAASSNANGIDKNSYMIPVPPMPMEMDNIQPDTPQESESVSEKEPLQSKKVLLLLSIHSDMYSYTIRKSPPMPKFSFSCHTLTISKRALWHLRQT